MTKVWRVALLLIIVGSYTVLAPFGYGAFAALSLLPTRSPARRARRLQAIMRFAFRMLHHLLRVCGLLYFDPRACRAQLPAGPVVLVANHPGLCDVSSSMAAFRDVTTAVKPELFRRRWLRPLLAGAGFFASSEDPLETGQIVDAGLARIRAGFHVLIFPEGTRSPEAGLHRFGRAAFEIACRADVPVVPLVISCNPVWLSKTRPVFPPPPQAPELTLTTLSPLSPRDYGFSSRKMRDVVEAQIRERLGVPVAHAGAHWNGTDANRSHDRNRNATQEAHRRVADA